MTRISQTKKNPAIVTKGPEHKAKVNKGNMQIQITDLNAKPVVEVMTIKWT